MTEVKRPQQVMALRSELELAGLHARFERLTDAELEEAWEEFSDIEYSAGFLDPYPEAVARFARLTELKP